MLYSSVSVDNVSWASSGLLANTQGLVKDSVVLKRLARQVMPPEILAASRRKLEIGKNKRWISI